MPTNSLLLDSVVIGIYLVLTFAIGIYFAKIVRGRSTGEEGFFLAGRKMPGWLNGVSYGATSLNADVAPTYLGIAVVVGLPTAWFYLSRFGLGLVILGLLFAIRWRQLGIATGPEFFSLRFGGGMGRGIRIYTSVWSVFIGMVPWIGAGMLGIHSIFAPVFGVESRLVTLALVLPVLMAYVWISGFAGVLVTDAFQSLVILGASLLILVITLSSNGGPAGLVQGIQDVLPAESGEILSMFPVPGHDVLSPLVVFAWLLVPTIGIGGSVATEGQRIFSARDSKEAAKVGIWGAISLFIMLLVLTLPALSLLTKHPELYHATPGEREKAYGMLLAEYLPAGLLGIALAALLASVMSTVSSHMNYGAQTLLNDVYRPLVREPGEREAVWIGRFLMLLIMGASIAVVYYSKSIIQIAVFMTGLFGSSATLGWGQWWWWRVNRWSWLSAILCGPLIYFLVGFLLPQWDWWAEQQARGEATRQGMAMLQAVIAMAVSTATWVTVTLLTRPERMETLTTFYRRARPLGVWGPVRRAVEEEQRRAGEPSITPPAGLIAGGIFASIVGWGWICMAILALSQFYIGSWWKGTLLAAGALLTALVFKRLFHWHLKRME